MRLRTVPAQPDWMTPDPWEITEDEREAKRAKKRAWAAGYRARNRERIREIHRDSQARVRARRKMIGAPNVAGGLHELDCHRDEDGVLICHCSRLMLVVR